MHISQGIEEYLEYKQAQRLSPRTLEDYVGVLERFARQIDKTEIEEIGVKDIRKFLASLSVSKKRVKNIHITLSSFWTWAVNEGVCDIHIPRLIKPPKPEKRVIVPIDKYEVQKMLHVVDLNFLRGKQSVALSDRQISNARRDQAIIFFLLDTGVRASELCHLRFGDIALQGALVHGKGAKDRIVPLSGKTRECMYEYTSLRQHGTNEFVFLSQYNRPLSSDTLGGIIGRVSKRAVLTNIHPHRFRHTFAINFLRNGGDIFSLQNILGHETLDMVKRYLAIAQIDIQAAHRKASPVVNWNLGR